MVVYICMLVGGFFIGLIFLGMVVNSFDSWRWFYWIFLIVIFLNFVVLIVMLFEIVFEELDFD